MPKIVPSQAREFIEQVFKPDKLTSPGHSIFHVDRSSQLAALVAIAEQIPDELLALAGAAYSEYVWALAVIRQQLFRWLHNPERSALPDVQGRNAVLVVYEALRKCPDETPSITTTALSFVDDTDLRNSIRLDISAANHDLVSHEYKGATVLAGSATEALLLWAIQRLDQATPGASKGAATALMNAGILKKRPHNDIEHWRFIELIEVAKELKLIAEDTAQQARLGKDFRNLIHPGRSARLGMVCDRGTALSALAAVEHIVRDLSLRFGETT